MPKLKISPISFLYISLLALSGTPHLFPLFCAIVLHEAGHLSFAALLGLNIKKLDLSLLGARISTESELSYTEEFLFALGGPLFSLLGFFLAFPIALKYASLPFCRDFLLPFSLICACLLIFNLLPLHSLDGGRMLSSLFMSLFSLSFAVKLMRALTLLTLLCLWLLSVYMMLKIAQGLPMFVFCLIFFIKCFVRSKQNRDFESI